MAPKPSVENHEARARADAAFHMGIAEATGNEYLDLGCLTVVRVNFWAGDSVMGSDGGAPGSPSSQRNNI